MCDLDQFLNPVTNDPPRPPSYVCTDINSPNETLVL